MAAAIYSVPYVCVCVCVPACSSRIASSSFELDHLPFRAVYVIKTRIHVRVYMRIKAQR